jgi:hypothetical protein
MTLALLGEVRTKRSDRPLSFFKVLAQLGTGVSDIHDGVGGEQILIECLEFLFREQPDESWTVKTRQFLGDAG